MRRAADEEAATFDKVAGKRVAELQDAVRDHSQLLEEFTRIHASTAEQLEEARSLIADLHQAAQERQADLDAESANQVAMAPGGNAGPPASTPDLRGLDHEGRPVGIESLADERFAELDGYVARSEAAQRALEERLADLEDEVAESAEALEARVPSTEPSAGVSTEQLERTRINPVRIRDLNDHWPGKREPENLSEQRSDREGSCIAACPGDRRRGQAERDCRCNGQHHAGRDRGATCEGPSRGEPESTAVEVRDGIEELHR
jgi:hypothetical protein